MFGILLSIADTGFDFTGIGANIVNILIGLFSSINGGTAIYLLLALRGERKNKTVIGTAIDGIMITLKPFTIILEAWANTALENEFVSNESKEKLRIAMQMITAPSDGTHASVDDIIAKGIEEGGDFLAKLMLAVPNEMLAKFMPQGVAELINTATNPTGETDFYK